MLRATVGLSRKMSRDYQSTGYQVTLDGEIPFGPDDPEAVLEKVKELYDLAQEARHARQEDPAARERVGDRARGTPLLLYHAADYAPLPLGRQPRIR